MSVKRKARNTFNPLALGPEHVELLTERILMGLGCPPPPPPSVWSRLRLRLGLPAGSSSAESSLS